MTTHFSTTISYPEVAIQKAEKRNQGTYPSLRGEMELTPYTVDH